MVIMACLSVVATVPVRDSVVLVCCYGCYGYYGYLMAVWLWYALVIMPVYVSVIVHRVLECCLFGVVGLEYMLVVWLVLAFTIFTVSSAGSLWYLYFAIEFS